jgi:RimJ/RimL family protein N-acetyltransferase
MRTWCLDVTHIETQVSYVDPDNARSSSLAEYIGTTLDANAQRPDPSDLVYRHYG